MNRDLRNEICARASAVITASGRVTELELARALKVSRTPVREALAPLLEDGFLVKRKKAGIMPRFLSLREIVELYDVRAALEALAARLVVAEANGPTLRALTRVAIRVDRRRVRLLPRRALIGTDDLDFHMQLIRASGNSYLARIFERFQILTLIFWQNQSIVPSRNRYSHADIIRALRKRDAAAAGQVARNHIMQGREHVIRYFTGPADGRELYQRRVVIDKSSTKK